jgi:F420H(2)-dependent quinone reductase
VCLQVVLRDRELAVTGHAATGDERARLWERWQQIDPKLDAFAALRPRETAVVVLRPSGTPPGRLA